MGFLRVCIAGVLIAVALLLDYTKEIEVFGEVLPDIRYQVGLGFLAIYFMLKARKTA